MSSSESQNYQNKTNRNVDNIYFIVNVAKTQLVLSTPAYFRSNSNIFIVLIHFWNSHTVYNSRLCYINKSKRQCEQTKKLRKSYKNDLFSSRIDYFK